MDEYILFVDKTVRDIFKNSDINNIKKYKLKKTEEIHNLSLDLQKEVLAKYPDLVNNVASINSLGSYLKELVFTLESIREKITSNSNKSVISKLTNPQKLLNELSISFEKSYKNLFMNEFKDKN